VHVAVPDIADRYDSPARTSPSGCAWAETAAGWAGRIRCISAWRGRTASRCRCPCPRALLYFTFIVVLH
jgi:hypothetical protein